MAYTDLTTAFVYKDPIFSPKLDALGENDDYLKDNGWETGTKTAFFQASAPVGWTKDTTAALDGKILRVVSGSGGSTGGSQDIATAITLLHGNSITSSGTHTHTYEHSHGQDTDTVTDASLHDALPANTSESLGNIGNRPTGSGSTSLYKMRAGTDTSGGTSGSGGDHNHGGSLANALTDISLKYVDVIVCTKDTSSGYTDQTSVFSHNKKTDFDEFDLYLSENDEYNYDRLTPSGSIALFGQENAPTGWTKLTTQNDAALRVETGTGGGTGGSAGFSQTITLQHTHTISADGSHTHTANHDHVPRSLFETGGVALDGRRYVIDGSNHYQRYDGSAATASELRWPTQTTNVDIVTPGTHTHTIGNALTDVTLAYFDVIQCSKDLTGASSSYTDLTSEFAYKKLVSKQRLNKLGANDDYIKYHIIPSTSVSFFYQAAAPLTWTKLTTQDDKGLRVVSGSTGGTAGGSQAISSAITLSHTHTISSEGHTHSIDAHTHSVTSDSSDTAGVAESEWIGTSNGLDLITFARAGSFSRDLMRVGYNNSLANESNQTVAHDHGAASGSSLSNVTLAYADIVMCSKNA